MRKNNNIIIELLKFNNGGKEYKRRITDYGYTHIALTVDNLKELHNSLLTNKISFLSDPKINDGGTHKVCFCKDFENNIIELVDVRLLDTILVVFKSLSNRVPRAKPVPGILSKPVIGI